MRIDLLNGNPTIPRNPLEKYSWVEPSETWEELKKQRAQQIRDEYDHVILYVSGGSDSVTMMNAFLNNDIPVDEIVTVSYREVDEPCVSGEYASKLVSSTKNFAGFYNFIRLSHDSVCKFLRNDDYLEDAPNFTGGLHSVSRMNVDYLEKYNFCPPRNRVGKVAHVYGIDCPNIQQIFDEYYAIYTPKLYFQAAYIDDNVGFFTDEKLYVKQCYIIAKVAKYLGYMPQYRKIIRDVYNEELTPPKPGGSVGFVLNKNIYSEPHVILKEYSKDDKFIDLFTRSTASDQMKIQRKVVALDMRLRKRYKLEI